jgi:hypothetical protein
LHLVCSSLNMMNVSLWWSNVDVWRMRRCCWLNLRRQRQKCCAY